MATRRRPLVDPSRWAFSICKMKRLRTLLLDRRSGILGKNAIGQLVTG